MKTINDLSHRDELDIFTSMLSPITNLKASQVAEFVGLSERQWHRLVEQKQAPQPIMLSQGAVAWRYEDVLAWCKSRPLRGESGVAK